jgi:hypothetical protein
MFKIMRKFSITLLLLSFYVVTLGQKDRIENRLQIGVVIQDSSAIPEQNGLTQNSLFNALLDSFQVISYFHDYTYYYGMQSTDTVEVFGFNLKSENNEDVDIIEFYDRLLSLNLFEMVIPYSKSLMVFPLDTSIYPISNTLSGNSIINAILTEYNIIGYYRPYIDAVDSNLHKYVRIECDCDIVELYKELSAFYGQYFGGFFIEEKAWTEDLEIQDYTIDNINIYPNPTNGIFVLNLGENTGVTHLDIVDISGKIIKSQNVEGNTAIINISDSKQGIYIVRIYFENRVINHKIIKS